MKPRQLLLALLCLPALALKAQTIGYLSYESVLSLMPEYAQAQEQLMQLRDKYDQEAKRGEEEFQRKFTEFLQGQKDFPQNILLKRQAELQTLMQNGLHFRQEAEELLAEAEQQLLADVRQRLDAVIQEVGNDYGYACIVNTDGNVCPFVNPMMGDDVTLEVMQRLGIAPQAEQAQEPEPAP